MVSDFGGRVRGAGDFPAAEVLGADGEVEEVGGGGVETLEVGGHLLGVVELVGDCGAVDGDCVGVITVCGVDALESQLVFGHGGWRNQE